MTKFIALFITMFIVGCAGTTAQSRSTTPTAEVRQGTTVISTDEYRELQQHSEDRSRLIDSQVSDSERQEAIARAVEQRRAEIEAEARRTARVETPTAPTTQPREEERRDLDRLIQAARDYDRPAAPAPQASAPAAPPAPQPTSGFGPPGMVAETQAYAGGSAPWQRYGGQTGGQEIIVRVNSAYAIALALDGQMIRPIAGGMPLSVPAYTGGGITQVPVLPATRSGGWTGSGTTREYRILADSLGRRQLSWTCYSVVSGRVGRPDGQGARIITVRPGTRVLITDSMCH